MSTGKGISLLSFAGSNLKRRPFRTVALLFVVSVLSFALFAGSVISLSLKNGTDGLAKRLGADLLVVPKGYEQRTEKILLRGEPSTFYMNRSWTERVRAVKGVRSVSPQLFVASLNADCCSTQVQIIGFDQSSDFTVLPWIKSSLPAPLAMDEVVVGASITEEVGQIITFFDRDYQIAAKMDSTGSGFDGSVFMSLEAAERASDDYVAKRGALGVPRDAISSVTVQLLEGYEHNEVARNISYAFDKEESGVSVITTQKLLTSVAAGLRSTVGIVVLFAVILWVMSVAVLSLVFSVILNERKREFGILRSLGATKQRLASLVLLEAGIVSLSGGALGIGFCALLVLPLRTYVLQTLGMPHLQPSALQYLLLVGASLALSFTVGPVSTMLSVIKISRGDAYAVIRDGDI